MGSDRVSLNENSCCNCKKDRSFLALSFSRVILRVEKRKKIFSEVAHNPSLALVFTTIHYLSISIVNMKYFLGFFLLILGSNSLCLADDSSMLSPVTAGQVRPVVICQTFLAGSQDTTDGSNGWSLTSHGVGEKLFTVNQDGEIVPQVAESVTKVDENTWDVTIKADYKFSDGTDVDAQHVADALQELNDLNGSAKGSLGVMTVSVVDEDTVRIESERPTHVMDAVLAEWVFVVYKKTPEGDFIYTGPYAIDVSSQKDIMNISYCSLSNVRYAFF